MLKVIKTIMTLTTKLMTYASYRGQMRVTVCSKGAHPLNKQALNDKAPDYQKYKRYLPCQMLILWANTDSTVNTLCQVQILTEARP